MKLFTSFLIILSVLVTTLHKDERTFLTKAIFFDCFYVTSTDVIPENLLNDTNANDAILKIFNSNFFDELCGDNKNYGILNRPGFFICDGIPVWDRFELSGDDPIDVTAEKINNMAKACPSLTKENKWFYFYKILNYDIKGVSYELTD